MAFLMPKPDWIDGVEDGEIKCDECSYETNNRDHLKEHIKNYHKPDFSEGMILYFGCTGSLEGRNALADRVSAQWIDMTGGQAAFKDGDLDLFGNELTEASRETGYKLYHAYRMPDPGLGLDFAQW